MDGGTVKLIVNGVPPWDGEYQFDDFAFTNRELYDIKQLSGLRASELIEALDSNDTSAYVGVGMVVLARHGKLLEPDDLWNAKVGSIRIDLGADADPPTQSASEGKPSETETSSGDDLNSGGE